MVSADVPKLERLRKHMNTLRIPLRLKTGSSSRPLRANSGLSACRMHPRPYSTTTTATRWTFESEERGTASAQRVDVTSRANSLGSASRM